MADTIGRHHFGWLPRLALFLLMLFMFLTAIELFGIAVKLFGAESARDLFSGLQNPFAGLAVGILATVMVQSSSVTTSTIVAMVGSGQLPLAYAVPMVMGANIGTSITCALVSLGHIAHGAAFRRAFAGATVHDMFNLLTVILLLPLEMATGFLRHGAEWLVKILPLGGSDASFHSPIKTSVKWAAGRVEAFLGQVLGLNGGWLATLMLAIGLAAIMVSLVVITKNMKVLMADRIEEWLNRVLRRRGVLGILIGALITTAVQSSSITTSLLIPMFGAGVLSLEAGFPIMLGANIGTTVTAILASTVTGPAGLTIAMVHLLFNLSGTLLFYPVRRLRMIPIHMAQRLADAAVRNRLWVLVYIFGVFIVLPVLGILIWRTP